MVGEAGIEPTTPGLEGRCSIRLSYSPTLLYFSWTCSIVAAGAALAGESANDSLKESARPWLRPSESFTDRRLRKAQWPPWAISTKVMCGIGENAGPRFAETAG